MKIAFFLNEFPALSQTFIINQIAGMAVKGHDIHIYALRQSKNPNRDLPIALSQRCSITYLNSYPSQFFGRVLILKKQMSDVGLVSSFILLLRTSKYFLREGFRGWLCIFERSLVIMENRDYDITHCQFATLWEVIEPLIDLEIISRRVVVSIRGYDITMNKHTKCDAYSSLFNISSLFLPVSRSLASHLQMLGCQKSKIKVHRSGLNLDLFKLRDIKPIGKPVKLLSVGRLVEKKGFQFGIDSVIKLVDMGVSVEYSIVGAGPLKKSLEGKIRRNQAESYVSLVGSVPHKETLDRMLRADILIIPCVVSPDGDQEGIPNVIKEAMALGVPVIASQHSGIPELIEDGKNGMLVSEKDVGGLARAVKCYIDLPLEVKHSMIVKARETVQNEYSIDALTEELEKIYQSLLCKSL